jgi:hypothetical protein
VTTGRVVVVVGGLVVVGGGLVVVVGEAPSELDPPVVVVVGIVVDVVLGDVTGVGLVVGGAAGGADAPGCSRATVIPMNAAAPPATTIAVLVNRVIRACALARAPGVRWSGARLTGNPGVAARALVPGRPFGPRQASAYGSVSGDASTSRWNLEGRIRLLADPAHTETAGVVGRKVHARRRFEVKISSPS